MNFAKHVYRGGLNTVSQPLQREVEAAIRNCSLRPARGLAPRIRSSILGNLVASGWSGETPVSPSTSRITITSKKEDVGLCLQTGNMGRLYADLIKLQDLYLKQAITAGVVIVFTADSARVIGSNLANGERLNRELTIFDRVIHLPLIVYSID